MYYLQLKVTGSVATNSISPNGDLIKVSAWVIITLGCDFLDSWVRLALFAYAEAF